MTIQVFASGANRRADMYVYASGANRLVKQMYVFSNGANRLVNGYIMTMVVGSSGGLVGYNTGAAAFGSLTPNTAFGGTVTRLCIGSISGSMGLHFICTADTSGLQALVLNGVTYSAASGFYNASQKRWLWYVSNTTPPYGLTIGGSHSVLIY